MVAFKKIVLDPVCGLFYDVAVPFLCWASAMRLEMNSRRGMWKHDFDLFIYPSGFDLTLVTGVA